MKKIAPGKLLGLMSLMLAVAIAVYLLQGVSKQPFSEVSVTGDITDEQRSVLYSALAEGQVVQTPMHELRELLEDISWVRQVSLTRRWPEVLVVHVEAEEPIALWNDDAYLNREGVVFHSPFVNQARLPQLFGPDGAQEVVMAQYLQLNSMLFQGEQYIEQLTLDARGNWQFKSNLGIEVLLGKVALMERMKRLLQVLDHISQQRDISQVSQVDTRYVNGAAVAWHEQGLVAQTVSTELKLATNYNSQREPKL